MDSLFESTIVKNICITIRSNLFYTYFSGEINTIQFISLLIIIFLHLLLINITAFVKNDIVQTHNYNLFRKKKHVLRQHKTKGSLKQLNNYFLNNATLLKVWFNDSPTTTSVQLLCEITHPTTKKECLMHIN